MKHYFYIILKIIYLDLMTTVLTNEQISLNKKPYIEANIHPSNDFILSDIFKGFENVFIRIISGKQNNSVKFKILFILNEIINYIKYFNKILMSN
jgi:hypothetical protein